MYITVHAEPSARKEKIEKRADGSFVISVKEPAERNLANKRIGEILSLELGLPTRLISGHRSCKKIFSVDCN